MTGWLRRLEARIAAVRMPSRPISAALVFAFLAFGTIVGRVTKQHAAGAQETSHAIVEVQAPAGGSKPPAISEAAFTSSKEEEEGGEEGGGASTSGVESSAGRRGGARAAGGKARSGSESQAGSGPGTSASESGFKSGANAKAPAKLPPIRHVFLIVLDDAAYAEVFGPESKSRYLARSLERKGQLLVRYYAVAHEQLADGIALVSGQGPTAATAADCPTYAEIAPAGSAAHGQVTGAGCVYPPATKTIASQLASRRLTWRAYVEGIGEGRPESSSACAHPQLGAADPTAAFGLPGASAPPGGLAAATFRDPFVYFRSVTDSRSCAAHVVGVDRLHQDLAHASRTPNLSYIVPSLCDDGSAKPCAPGKPAGMVPADAFLRRVVPDILASRAYRRDGLLVVTVDEAPSTGEYADSSACCGQPKFPNLSVSAVAGSGGGGGEVGALLVSPFVKGGGVSQQPYNHFSLLRTIEDVFGVSHLGYAGLSGVKALSPSLFAAG